MGEFQLPITGGSFGGTRCPLVAQWAEAQGGPSSMDKPRSGRRGHLPNEVFLSELTSMLTATASKGSCFVSMKRHHVVSEGKGGDREAVTLMRAKVGSRTVSDARAPRRRGELPHAAGPRHA